MSEKCPVCTNGTLRHCRFRERMRGVDLGTYPGQLCNFCAETFVDARTMRRIETRAEELGDWGVARKVALARSANTGVVGSPSKPVGVASPPARRKPPLDQDTDIGFGMSEETIRRVWDNEADRRWDDV